MALNRNQRRRALRARALDYLGSKCSICGYQKCMAALDIHHTNPEIKEFTISARLVSWDRLTRELDKCVVLCANCHRETHDGLHPHYLDLDEPRYEGEDEDLPA